LSTPFQNRLVGTIIVAAAAIIFLPDILDGKKQTHQADFEGIPQAPKFQSSQTKQAFPEEKLAKLPQEQISNETALDDTPIDEAVNNQNTATESVNSNQENSKNAATVKVATLEKPTDFSSKQITNSQPETKLPAKAIAGEAWVIQLGSFRHQKNVEELVAKLKLNGYTVFTKPIKTKSGTLTKVFIGPELIKSALEKKLPELKRLTKVDGKIARFYPTK